MDKIIFIISLAILYLVVVWVYSKIAETIFEDEGEEGLDGKRREDEAGTRES